MSQLLDKRVVTILVGCVQSLLGVSVRKLTANVLLLLSRFYSDYLSECLYWFKTSISGGIQLDFEARIFVSVGLAMGVRASII